MDLLKLLFLLAVLLVGMALACTGCAATRSQSAWQDSLRPAGDPGPELTLARGDGRTM